MDNTYKGKSRFFLNRGHPVRDSFPGKQKFPVRIRQKIDRLGNTARLPGKSLPGNCSVLNGWPVGLD